MKKTLLIFLILSSNLIDSTNIQIKTTKNERFKPLGEHETSCHYLNNQRKNTNLDIQIIKKANAFLRDNINENSGSPTWKIIKGLAGLYVGANLFLSGSNGIFNTLFYHDELIANVMSPLETLSPLEKFLINRYLWLSINSSLTVFAAWILKKSLDNLYHGFNGTEENTEWLDQKYSDY